MKKTQETKTKKRKSKEFSYKGEDSLKCLTDHEFFDSKPESLNLIIFFYIDETHWLASESSEKRDIGRQIEKSMIKLAQTKW